MLKEERDPAFSTISPSAAAWPSWCDSCRSVPCSVYCRADAAYLCLGCDTSIHSANTLAGRHHRVPVIPIQAGGLIVGGISAPQPGFLRRTEEEEEEEEEEEGRGFMTGGEVDEYLDLVEFSSCQEEGKNDEKEKQNGCANYEREADVAVPVQCLIGQEKKQLIQSFQMGYEGFGAGMDYSSTDSSLDHNASLSTTETAGIIESTMIDISSSHNMSSKVTVDLFSAPLLQLPHIISPMDREARVLRYREKKKTRKFQKIIRYESRKAYAETRPRIKGRFAKRKDVEHEVDQMFAAPVTIETNYGVVPSY